MNKLPVLVLLAGGKSSRMGFPKGLLDYNGTPWILEQINRFGTIKKGSKVFVGLGYDYKKYIEAIPWFKYAINDFYTHNEVKIKVAVNQQPELGPFSTLLSVLKEVKTNDSVLVQPVDVPLLNKSDLLALCQVNNTIVIPKCNLKKGHPVKLSSEFWNILLTIDIKSENARLDYQIKELGTKSITYFKTTDISVYQNINKIKGWKKYRKLFDNSISK